METITWLTGGVSRKPREASTQEFDERLGVSTTRLWKVRKGGNERKKKCERRKGGRRGKQEEEETRGERERRSTESLKRKKRH